MVSRKGYWETGGKGTMGVKTTNDIKLVIQPVHSVMVHEYVFEGPCRFGSGDELTVEFDRMNGAEGLKVSKRKLSEYLEGDEDFEILHR